MPDRKIRWTSKRNCSASPGQLAAAFASVVALSFIIGVGFALYGLWLVLPFVGIELVAIAAAFYCYGRHAADYETIELDGQDLRIEQVQGARRSVWHLAARRVRIESESGARTGSRLLVAAADLRLEIGAHLLDARRRQLALELQRALRFAPA